MNNGIIKAVVILTILLSFSSCKAQKKAVVATATKAFSLPDIPSVITSPEERADYLCKNYWINYNFADTSQMHTKSEVTEQLFVDFINVFPIASKDAVDQSINTLLNSALSSDTLMFDHFTKLFEKYLYDPNSPMRNEELYLPVLRYITSSTMIGDVDKIRPAYQLEMVLKNRVGDTAADFNFTTASGKKSKLSYIRTDYIIIFFNNPGCPDCRRVKSLISNSSVFNSLLYNPKAGKPTLTILALYPDTDLEEWHKESYSDKWINAHDESQNIKKNQLYDLRAIPCFYLLDKNGKVIMKDAPIEMIERWISEQL